LSLQGNRHYIVLDLEATCWNDDKLRDKYQSEIIEIGAVKINDKLEIIDEYDRYIKPKLNPVLSDFCKELTTIKQEDIDIASGFYEVISDFKNWIHSHNTNINYNLCSWGFYDKKQLVQDCTLHNLPIKWLDKHISVKHQFCKNRRIKHVGMLTALRMLNLKHDGTHHRGIDDAKNIANIFIKTFNEYKFV